MSNRHRLQDFLITPVQHLTRYKIHLEAILKVTEDEQQRKDLMEMVRDRET